MCCPSNCLFSKDSSPSWTRHLSISLQRRWPVSCASTSSGWTPRVSGTWRISQPGWFSSLIGCLLFSTWPSIADGVAWVFEKQSNNSVAWGRQIAVSLSNLVLLENTGLCFYTYEGQNWSHWEMSCVFARNDAAAVCCVSLFLDFKLVQIWTTLHFWSCLLPLFPTRESYLNPNLCTSLATS